jgi:hypothetical protein
MSSSVREILIERGLMRPRTALDDTTSSPERGLMERSNNRGPSDKKTPTSASKE